MITEFSFKGLLLASFRCFAKGTVTNCPRLKDPGDFMPPAPLALHREIVHVPGAAYTVCTPSPAQALPHA